MADIAENLQGLWPLSAAQKGIWLGQQLDQKSPLYNTAECIEILGPLDAVVFEQSLRQMVAEAETLNLRFDVKEADPIEYLDPTLSWSLQHLDLSSSEDPWQAARDWMRQDLKQTVNLQAEKPFAQALIQAAPDRHFWYQRIHHIAIDGYGTSLLVKRVAEIYTAAIGGQPVPPSPFGPLQAVLEEDFAYQISEQKQRDREYWLKALSNGPDPVSFCHETALSSTSSLRQSNDLSPEAFARLQTVARQMGASWPDLLLAATAVYLHQVTGAADLILALPMMGRLGSAALRVPAMVMNIVPLRVFVNPGIRFSDLVAQIGQRLREMRPHHRYRYEQLRRDLKRVGGSRRLFGPGVNIMPFDYTLSFGNAEGIAHNISAGPVEDLAIEIRTHANGRELKIDFDGNPACYSLEDITRHQQQWLAELQAALDNPDRVIESASHPIAGLSGSAEGIIKGDSLDAPVRSVLDRFIEQVRLHPHAEAVVEGDSSLSYSELLSRARDLGSRLVAAGVEPDQIVAIHLPRSCDAIVAIWGVWFSGAASLFLDPKAPSARNASILQDARPPILITKSNQGPQSIPDLPPLLLLDDLNGFPTAETLPEPQENTLAYVIYTSGSTGKPKGVEIPRSALASFASAALQRYGIRAGDRHLQFAALIWDTSLEEIVPTLCSGATLVLRSESMVQSIPDFLRICSEQEITFLNLPTAFWHELAFYLANRQATLPPNLRIVIVGGEAAHPERINQWHSVVGNQVRLLNTYGPSETTVAVTAATLEPGCVEGGEVPIGYPLPGIDIVVLDPAGYPVPPGEQGELCVLGPTLARGYRGLPQLTADRFVHLDRFPGQPRAYRTGDRVFVRPDGQLVYIGRLDAEFKISGHRVEPAEIEGVLSAIPVIREAAVVGYTLPEGIKRLCAYLVAEKPHPSVPSLRQHLAQFLPAALVPAGFNFVDALPKTLTGKVDRSALRERSPEWLTAGSPGSTTQETQGTHSTDLSPLEALILQTWETILGNQGLTVQDDFFEWGGQSLQTIQVGNLLSAKLNCEIPIATLFRYPTAAGLAEALSSQVQVDVDLLDPTVNPIHESAEDRTKPSTLFAPLLPITEGRQTPLFCLHPVAGLGWCYMGLARHLGTEQPLYGLQSPYLDPELSGANPPAWANWAQIVEKYLALVRQVQPRGPYRLLGWSFGGMIAQSMATQFQQQGDEVERLILLDAYPSDLFKKRDLPNNQQVLAFLLQAIGQEFSDPKIPQGTEEVLTRLRQGPLGSQFDLPRLNTLLEITRYNVGLTRQAPTPDRYHGDLVFFTAKRGRTDPDLTHKAWLPFVKGSIENYDLDAEHGQILTGDCLRTVAKAIATHLAD